MLSNDLWRERLFCMHQATVNVLVPVNLLNHSFVHVLDAVKDADTPIEGTGDNAKCSIAHSHAT